MQSLIKKFNIDIDSIDKDVRLKGFSIIHPDGLKNVLESARQEYHELIKSIEFSASKEKFDYRSIKKCPIRKISVGSKNSVGEQYAQVLTTSFIDCHESPYAFLNETFQLLIEIRNTLMKIELDFGFVPERDGFWNACRVHHYPRGGGFMTIHKDTYFPNALGDRSFFQILIPLSVKGRDFVNGGGIVEDLKGNRLNTDDVAGLGSIIIFDGRIFHGVDDVDPGEILDFSSFMGRIALVANVYKVLDI